MADTRIEWAQKVWNPVTGCTRISSGCQNCYAERMAKRLRGRCGYPDGEPFRVTLHPDKLNEPLKWRKPSRIFVCSMGDLFHEDVPEDFIWQLIGKAYEAKHHTFLTLTKRADRMEDILTRSSWWNNDTPQNIWLGVTVENQEQDWRIKHLLNTPAAVRFVSVEPMLSPVRLILARRYCTNCNYLHWSYNPAGSGFVYKEVYCPECGFAYGYHSPEGNSSIDWVICGSESGQNRRPANIEWIRSLKNQCVDADVPFFLKQMEINGRLVKMPKLDGQVWDQFPEVKP